MANLNTKPNTNTSIPTPTIGPATYYDVGSQQLYLTITYPSGTHVKGNAIDAYLITSSSTNPMFIGNNSFPVAADTAVITVSLEKALASKGGQIIATGLADNVWESSPPSEPWQLPTINLSPITSPASINFTSLGSVEVTWTWIAGMGATAQLVTLAIKGQPTIKAMVANAGPTAIATFTMSQANNLFTPGKEMAIQCIAISPGLRAIPVDASFIIPQSGRITHYSFSNSPPVSSNCSVTGISGTLIFTTQLWWGTPEGAIETVVFPSGSAEQFAGKSTIADTGSCLTSIHISNTYQQVWWIMGTGAIDGQINPGNGWRPPGTGPEEKIPFNVANIASTTNGGSMASLLHDGTVFLFWVGPQGAIKCCRWLASSGWQPVCNALPPGIASTTSQLSVLSVGSSVYLFCVGSDNLIVGASWPNAASSGSLALMSQFAVPSSGKAAPEGGLTSFSVSAQEVAVLWTTSQNNIEMALVFLGAPSSNIQRSLTLPQSVLKGTGIAACSIGTNQWSIWWIGQASDLRRTNVDLTKLTLTPNYPVFELLGPGSCKQMRSLMVASGYGTQIGLVYVNANDIVAGLSCPP
ncbi:guanine deaminase [Fusarium denticulatum]|uniref:Guanine deaminase n=1 Tax=Fusarium denticulatum TaxID=48507 RepID=A0A8H5UKA5_9HYPO|nr:guanine deaminase [Fusarium denticulatum]